MERIDTRCCIAGGGPAGIMLGYLLARAGIDVVVLEKWPDFFRDFRGDTIHPSTMDVLHELGLLEEFLRLPHDETKRIALHVGGEAITVADFTHLPCACPFVGFIPQWDFLNFIATEGRRYPGFHLMMETEATDLLRENGRVVGVLAKRGNDELEIRAELTVGADGRHSTVREKAGLPVEDLGAPIDVLWFRLPRTGDGTSESLGYVDRGRMFVLLNRGTYWQCAALIKKGDADAVKARGLDDFRDGIVRIVPMLQDAVRAIGSWDDVKLLSVDVDHLREWSAPGLVCIGDAAHAMSPVGGVGINLAVQDAVAAANILAPAFRRPGGIRRDDLLAIQRRRAWPARVIQRAQVLAHTHILEPILAHGDAPMHPAWQLRLLRWLPVLRRVPARLIGIGVRPEHVSRALRASFKHP
jgi:2-polyprenyl-6-methoxyphenol hydroxylase-like FAD-dependent oxidoreductase